MGESGEERKCAETSLLGDKRESMIEAGDEIKCDCYNRKQKQAMRNYGIKWPAATFDEVETFDNLTIFEVPTKLRKVDNDAYSPRIISIEPYRRQNGDHELVTMIEHKCRYMRHFFERIKDPQQSLQFPLEFTFPVYNLDATVRRSYARGVRNYDADCLEHMVSFDGIFIWQLFLRYDQYCKDLPLIDPSDAIFNNALMIPALRSDLALLENQIPLFVLHELYNVVKPRIMNYKPPDSITSLALKFFEPMNQKEMMEEECGGTEHKHLLDLLHKFYLPTSLLHKPDPGINVKNWGFDFCASELSEAGIEFQTESLDHSFSITFKNGVLRIPQVFIDDKTSSLLRNLIA